MNDRIAISEVGRRARRRISLRLLPLVFSMYVVCYVDRANVAFANLRMSAELGMSARAYGLGVGIFFLGYVLFEIPGALIVERWSARKWMARIMITWGVITIGTGFIHTTRQFYLARFLVGIAEASFFPGIIVYLTHWFQHSDRAKAIGFFYTAVSTATVAGSLVASGLIGVHWLGIAGWRWLFILEGIPPIILGVVAFLYMTDWPQQARWLPDDERAWIVTELEAEAKAKKQARDYTIGQAFRDRQVVLLTIAWFLALVGSLGSLYWIPIFVRRLSGLPDSKVALLVTLPGILGIAGTMLNGWHSDKAGERRWHASLPLLITGLLYLLLLVPRLPFPVAMVLMTFGAGFYYSFQPVFWSIPTMILCDSAAAACFGLINSMGQIGGFVGPYAVGYLNEKTGNLTAAFALIAGCFLLAGSVILLLGTRKVTVPHPTPLA
ncbi:MAG: MFS transporter [Acidobacteria bacterium]|nr:MFS transporter [Acidobacteriota bacterium]